MGNSPLEIPSSQCHRSARSSVLDIFACISDFFLSGFYMNTLQLSWFSYGFSRLVCKSSGPQQLWKNNFLEVSSSYGYRYINTAPNTDTKIRHDWSRSHKFSEIPVSNHVGTKMMDQEVRYNV